MRRFARAKQRDGFPAVVTYSNRQLPGLLIRQVFLDLAVGAEQFGLRNARRFRSVVFPNGIVVDLLLGDGNADIRGDQSDGNRRDEEGYR